MHSIKLTFKQNTQIFQAEFMNMTKQQCRPENQTLPSSIEILLFITDKKKSILKNAARVGKINLQSLHSDVTSSVHVLVILRGCMNTAEHTYPRVHQ